MEGLRPERLCSRGERRDGVKSAAENHLLNAIHE